MQCLISKDLRTSSLKSVLQAVLLSLLLFSSVSWAASESVGRVIVSRGDVFAEQADGTVRVLQRRAKIFEGDTLVTGKNGRVQIRFSDKGLLELQANTRFLIETYHFDSDYRKRAASYSLLKGGMRTVTGLIGKTNKKNYKVETPVATIGLRGTHWGAHWCESECVSANGTKLEAGLYGGVVNGGVIVTNSGGQKSFSSDEYFFVANSNELPKALTKPPGVVFSEGTPSAKRGGSESADGESESGGSESADGGSESGGSESTDGESESGESRGREESADSSENSDSDSRDNESDSSSEESGSNELKDVSESSDGEVSDASDSQGRVELDESESSSESVSNDNEVDLTPTPEAASEVETGRSSEEDVMPESLEPPAESDDAPHDSEQNQPEVNEELNNSGTSAATDDVELDDESDYLDNKVVDAPKSAGAITVHRPQNQAASISVLSVANGDDLKVSNSGTLEEVDVTATGVTLDRNGVLNSDASMRSVGDADVYWGRWQKGFNVEDSANNLQDSTGSLLYIYTPDMTPVETITSKTGGIVQFNHVGGPAAVDELGGTGSMSGSSFTVNFGAQTVDSANYQLNMDSGREYSAGLSGAPASLSDAMAGNMSLSGTCSGVDCGAAGTAVTGTAGIGFVGSDAQGAISGIGLQDANGGRGVTAVGVFEAQP